MARRRPQHLKRQAGQSVIVAVAVMFLLAFLAALFIVLLARNLERTARASDTLTADFYAQAGIHYADLMLQTSPAGADWRPALQNLLDNNIVSLTGGPGTYALVANKYSLTTDEANAYVNFANSNGLVATKSNDPDKFWLDQGFSRYNTQGGRFLIRVSYGAMQNAATGCQPNQGGGCPISPADPFESTPDAGRYIRIESIGRTGEVDPTDPTTFPIQPIRLHAEQLAYKPIGIVDYGRFITNKYNRTDAATLGVPSAYDPAAGNTGAVVTPGVFDFTGTAAPFAPVQFPLVTTYGEPGANNSGSGGSLRCNADLRLYGLNAAFLNGANGEDWEIAGKLTFDGFNTATPVQQMPTQLAVIGTETDGVTAATGPHNGTPSNGATFTTLGDLIRDGSAQNDSSGLPRSIKRLNPPSLDATDPSTNLTRYLEITQTGTGTGPVNTTTHAADGPYQPETPNTPATVYIDNAGDSQPESTNVVSGSYTLRDDWLNHTSKYWQGPFYNPPGATITFGQIEVLVSGVYQPMWGFTVIRSDTPIGQTSSSPTTWTWKTPGATTDTPGTATVNQMEFVYGVKPATFTQDPTQPIYFLGADNASPAPSTNTALRTNNDVVIYAAGNVRVRGVISDPRVGTDGTTTFNGYEHHVTVVSNQIAYIEGSILKGGSSYGIQQTAAALPDYTSGSSCAILAERYVCVNTTQFLAGSIDLSSVPQDEIDPNTQSVEFGPDELGSLSEAFDLPPTQYANPPKLYLSEYSGGIGQSYGNIVFEAHTLYDAAGVPTDAPTNMTYDGGYSTVAGFNVNPIGASNTPNRQILDLVDPTVPQPIQLQTTGFTHLQYTISKSSYSSNDYLLERAAALPSDVRIESALYAQNNSFFVIPGPWFNSDSQDNLQYFSTNSARPRPNTGTNGATNSVFPFYGQPIDMKITIAGSVAENLPANISDQSAWNLRWAWIPQFQGSPASNVPAGHQPLGGAGGLALRQNCGINATLAATMPQVGLNIDYDEDEATATATVKSGAGAATDFVRLDQYGHPLPLMPNLPVSPDLLFSGQTGGNSLVQ